MADAVGANVSSESEQMIVGAVYLSTLALAAHYVWRVIRHKASLSFVLGHVITGILGGLGSLLLHIC